MEADGAGTTVLVAFPLFPEKFVFHRKDVGMLVSLKKKLRENSVEKNNVKNIFLAALRFKEASPKVHYYKPRRPLLCWVKCL